MLRAKKATRRVRRSTHIRILSIREMCLSVRGPHRKIKNQALTGFDATVCVVLRSQHRTSHTRQDVVTRDLPNILEKTRRGRRCMRRGKIG